MIKTTKPEAVRQVLNRIKEESTAFSMLSWGVTPSVSILDPLSAQYVKCGTTACIAGHALLLASTASRQPRGITSWIEADAAECMGLVATTPAEVNRLFYDNLWPSWANKMKEHTKSSGGDDELDRQIAIELLSAILHEEDPWDESYDVKHNRSLFAIRGL